MDSQKAYFLSCFDCKASLYTKTDHVAKCEGYLCTNVFCLRCQKRIRKVFGKMFCHSCHRIEKKPWEYELPFAVPLPSLKSDHEWHELYSDEEHHLIKRNTSIKIEEFFDGQPMPPLSPMPEFTVDEKDDPISNTKVVCGKCRSSIKGWRCDSCGYGICCEKCEMPIDFKNKTTGGTFNFCYECVKTGKHEDILANHAVPQVEKMTTVKKEKKEKDARCSRCERKLGNHIENKSSGLCSQCLKHAAEKEDEDIGNKRCLMCKSCFIDTRREVLCPKCEDEYGEESSSNSEPNWWENDGEESDGEMEKHTCDLKSCQWQCNLCLSEACKFDKWPHLCKCGVMFCTTCTATIRLEQGRVICDSCLAKELDVQYNK